MSRLTDIKQKILQLGSGEFQEFCDAYLARKGYEEPFSLGMKAGTLKTTVGTPDSYYKNKRGKYIFVEYTTQEQNLDKKIMDDICKCLDKKKTGVDVSEIEEIVYCHTSSTFTVANDSQLYKMCEDAKVKLVLIGIDVIANDLYRNYPVITRDFLGIPIDTEQIFEIEEFIRKYDSNKMAAPLSTEFQFRENELIEIIETLSDNSTVIVSGRPGVGKTRLVLEATKRFTAKNGFKLLGIKSNGQNIFEDLRCFIESPGKYVIFIDDAHELKLIELVLEYLNKGSEGYDVKIIATVRDYASPTIIDKFKTYSIPRILKIESLNDEEIRNLIEANLGITNVRYLERIAKISKGNPRIAFFTGMIAKEKNSLEAIRDANEVYSSYYARNLKESNIASDKKLSATACIISLLQVVDLTNTDIFEYIFDLFGITKEEFSENITKLHNMEFVEIHYGDIAKVTDQCFSNYMLCYTLLETKQINLSDFLLVCFFKMKEKVINCVNILLNIFDSEENQHYIMKEVNFTWDKLKDERNTAFFKFVKVFNNFRPEETLIMIQNLIERIEVIDMDLEAEISKLDFKGKNNITQDDVLDILCSISSYDNIDTAIELIYEYCKKKPYLSINAVNKMVDGFGVSRTSTQDDYQSTKTLVEIISRIDVEDALSTKISLHVAFKTLKLHCQWTESGSKSVKFYDIPVILTEGSKEYRSRTWEYLINILEQEKYEHEIYDFLDGYALDYRGFAKELDFTVFEYDFDYIFRLLKMLTKISPLKQMILAQHFKSKYESFNLEVDRRLYSFLRLEEYTSLLTIISEYCNSEMVDYKLWKLSKEQEILKIVVNSSVDELVDLIKKCNFCSIDFKGLGRKERVVNEGVTKLFDKIIESGNVHFLEVVQAYLKYGENLNVHPKLIIMTLIESLGTDATYEIINLKEFRQKNLWLLTFFELIPESDVNSIWLERLFTFFGGRTDENVESTYSINLRCLDKFLTIEPEIYIKISGLIIKKFQYNTFIARCYLEELFICDSYSPETLLELFSGSEDVLQDIYFKCIEYGSCIDYSGHILKEFVDKNSNWLKLYMEYIFSIEKLWRNNDVFSRLSALWSCENYLAIFDDIFEKIMENSKSLWHASNTIENAFTEGEHCQEKRLEWASRFINIYFEDKERIRIVFKIVNHFSGEVRKSYVEQLTALNEDFELFKEIPWSKTVEDVSIFNYQKKIDFFESLYPSLKGAKFLKHRNLIANEIKYLKEQIADEQKRIIFDL